MCGNPFGTLTRLVQVLEPELVARVNPPPRVVEPTRVACTRCHNKVNATYEWCPHCGAPLRATPCAYCGRRIAAGLEDCPSCGAPIQVK